MLLSLAAGEPQRQPGSATLAAVRRCRQVSRRRRANRRRHLGRHCMWKTPGFLPQQAVTKPLLSSVAAELCSGLLALRPALLWCDQAGLQGAAPSSSLLLWLRDGAVTKLPGYDAPSFALPLLPADGELPRALMWCIRAARSWPAAASSSAPGAVAVAAAALSSSSKALLRPAPWAWRGSVTPPTPPLPCQRPDLLCGVRPLSCCQLRPLVCPAWLPTCCSTAMNSSPEQPSPLICGRRYCCLHTDCQLWCGG